jgi:hypothetical protein
VRWDLAEWEPDVRMLAERGEKCSAKLALAALDEVRRLEQALKDAEPMGSAHDHIGALTGLVEHLKRDADEDEARTAPKNACPCGAVFATPQGLGLHFKAGKCGPASCPACGGGVDDGGCIGFGGASRPCGWTA